MKNKSMMVFGMNVFGKKETNGQEWSLKQLLLWAQVSQLTFIYLLRLTIIPYWP